jgi:hypothetical protein
MRIALTTALMVVAALAWADEPNPPDTKTEAASEAVQEDAAKQATEATEQATEQASEQASEATAAADEANADDKPFKVPAGYRSKRVNGKTLYCSSTVTSGSRVGKEKCRTEQQLREIQKQREAATAPQTQSNCGGAVCAKN